MSRAVRRSAIVLEVLIVIGLILPRVDVNSFRPKLEFEMTTAGGK